MSPALPLGRQEAADGVTIDHLELQADWGTDTVVSAARVPVSLGAADANGDRATAAGVDLTLNAGTTARWVVSCENLTGTLRKYKTPLGSDGWRKCHIQGDVFESPGHNFLDEQTICLLQDGTAPFPAAGVVEGDGIYYVEVVDVNSFLIHSAPGQASQVTGITRAICRAAKIVEHSHSQAATVTINPGTVIGVGA